MAKVSSSSIARFGPRLLVAGLGVILVFAIIYKANDWSSNDGQPGPPDEISVVGNGRGPRNHGKAPLTKDFFRLMSDDNFSEIDEIQIRLNDGNGDRIPLSAIRTPTGEISRIASSTAPRGMSKIDFEGFFDQVTNHGEGLSMYKATQIPDQQLSHIHEVLKRTSLILSSDDGFDLLPIEILSHDGAREIAWLLTVRSSSKVSLLEDGVPSGVNSDESIMRFKRQWYLLPSEPSKEQPILFSGHTFEDHNFPSAANARGDQSEMAPPAGGGVEIWDTRPYGVGP